MYTPGTDCYDAMAYRRSGKSGLLLPAISLGLWHNFGGVDSLENSRAMVRRAFDLGVTPPSGRVSRVSSSSTP